MSFWGIFSLWVGIMVLSFIIISLVIIFYFVKEKWRMNKEIKKIENVKRKLNNINKGESL
jgi:uncharacterized membrane protein